MCVALGEKETVDILEGKNHSEVSKKSKNAKAYAGGQNRDKDSATSSALDYVRKLRKANQKAEVKHPKDLMGMHLQDRIRSVVGKS